MRAMRIAPGTRALVTGASRGIGRALAEALAARGAAVGLMARDADALERLAARLGGGARALPADVGDRAAVAAAIDAFAADGGLHLVVANAGIAHYGEFARTPLERAEEMTRINWLGTLYTVHAALPHLRGGHIVVVSSGAGLRAFPQAAAYGATKAAQRAFAEALRHELAGVSVTTVFPGEIDTDLHAHERDRMPAWYGARKASPERLADVVIAAVEADRRTVAYPREVALLGLNGLAPGLTDRILRRLRGRAAAPR
jgi:short-subunit dehydrogenase